MRYKNKFGHITICEPESEWQDKTIGLSMSGGADSTMLCYLLAHTSQKRNLNLTIQPYNGYDIWCTHDSEGLPYIIDYIKNIFPDVKIEWPITTVFDTKGSKENHKNVYIRDLVKRLRNSKMIDIWLNGVCLGPPLDVQETFTGEAKDYFLRRPGKLLWHEVENAGNYAPYKNIDKRFIMQCYIDFDQQALRDLTNSCTNVGNNCGYCWWCQERAWAIKETRKFSQ